MVTLGTTKSSYSADKVDETTPVFKTLNPMIKSKSQRTASVASACMYIIRLWTDLVIYHRTGCR